MIKDGSIFLKYLIGITSLGGVALNLVCAVTDGYSHWSKRLLYFTGQSNIWIGVTCIFLATLLLLKKSGKKVRVKPWIYLFKYIFTVSIAVTGIVYCFLLAPFADESYNVWSLGSILTHFITPVLSVIDFFADGYDYAFKNRHAFYCAVPPLIYTMFSGVLSVFGVDFGRGEVFPYFFMNFNTPSKLFGFTPHIPIYMGSAYWILLMAMLVLCVAFTFMYLHPATRRRRKAGIVYGNE